MYVLYSRREWGPMCTECPRPRPATAATRARWVLRYLIRATAAHGPVHVARRVCRVRVWPGPWPRASPRGPGRVPVRRVWPGQICVTINVPDPVWPAKAMHGCGQCMGRGPVARARACRARVCNKIIFVFVTVGRCKAHLPAQVRRGTACVGGPLRRRDTCGHRPLRLRRRCLRHGHLCQE